MANLPAEHVDRLIRIVNARMPTSVTPTTRIEIHPSDWIAVTGEIERLKEDRRKLVHMARYIAKGGMDHLGAATDALALVGEIS